jgi:uncharacterized flavoprotein (TIGR03862 family)
MKASPLLRAWLARLAGRGVRFHPRHRWTGWDEAGALRFETPAGPVTASPAATVLALGGASWPRLGSDGEWREALTRAGVPVSPFRPANMGFDVAWPAGFRERFAGHPVKSVTARAGDGPAVPGEFVVTAGGVEGGLVYTLSSALRDRIDAGQPAVMTLDLVPGRDRSRLARDLARVPPRASLSTRLRKGAGLTGVKAALVRLCADPADLATSDGTAAAIKALALTLAAPRPVEEAISTAGGVTLDAIDRSYMLKDRPGVFVAGEMIDWEAPTGGYLISGSLATGRAAAEGVLARLGIPSPD